MRANAGALAREQLARALGLSKNFFFAVIPATVSDDWRKAGTHNSLILLDARLSLSLHAFSREHAGMTEEKAMFLDSPTRKLLSVTL